ncbi:hypothetical protein DFJ74DRAFT_647628 [Hyaloraphidium curvatum]|nr:hypothetical protein DFJ74DRAFT_647741 [Hyaloraphidium curvatum]KAI9001869.1 hypothetical protein DFJ74DRAFT_647628 [Hyaloraphidium curvatum]
MASFDAVAHLEPYGPSGPESLAAERAGASFPVGAMESVVRAPDELAIRRTVLRRLESELLFTRLHFSLPHHEQVRVSVERTARLAEISREERWGMQEWNTALGFVEHGQPLTLTTTIFGGLGKLRRRALASGPDATAAVSIIETEATDEQRKELLEKVANFNIIGSYAQTELGHGSNVQGLETEVHYIQEDDCFEVRSPFLTSAKWWIGALGKSATHVALMARLVVGGRNRGPHNFVFRIRDERTHEPLPGVFVGDIGSKYGNQGIDNGFCVFTNFRIPKTALLSRFSKVSRDGKYVRDISGRIVYTAMMMIRAYMVRGAAASLAKSVTIATRFSAVRRQTAANDPSAFNDSVGAAWSARTGLPAETRIIDHSQQTHRLCYRLAEAYALQFVGRDMMQRQYAEYEDLLRRDPAAAEAMQPEVHATASSLKALCTDMAYAGIDDMRRACGGHGYSEFSGISNNDYGIMVTGEGDNWMIALQCARYLHKAMVAMRTGKKGAAVGTPTTAYLLEAARPPPGGATKCAAARPADLLDADTLVKIFAARAGRLVAWYADEVDAGVAPTALQWEVGSPSVARPRLSAPPVTQGNMISKAHGQFIIASSFAEQLRLLRGRIDAGAWAALERLLFLYCLSTVEAEPAFATNGYLSGEQLGWVRRLVRGLVAEVRKDAVALTDAWGFTDWELKSALGRYDGRVYETLFKWAIADPLNQGNNYPVASFIGSTYRPMLDNDGSKGPVISGMLPVKARL